jgi:peptide/nickel transport system ATP-binding protein
VSAVPAQDAERPVLRVTDLAVTFLTDGGEVRAVDGASFELAAGGAVALVGESGCGKTATAHALLQILPDGARIARGTAELDGRDLVSLPEREMRSLRGDRIAIVFQEPMSALNPVYTVGSQIAEAVRLHRDVSRREAKRLAIEALRAVGMPAPEDRERDYPYQLSGGMRQRVLLAMAMVNEPSVLVADEPTTSLDATVEAQILERIATLRAERHMALLLVSHDFDLVAAVVDEIVVMYAGRTIEAGPRDRVLDAPSHPYTRALLQCAIPRRLPALVSRKQRRDPLPTIEGRPPDLRLPVVGCVYADRCPEADAGCRVETPPDVPVGGGGWVRCLKR